MSDVMTKHQISRVRRETRRRRLTVASVERITPKMVRIGFTSQELADFESLGCDDHIKLIFSSADEERAGERRPEMRDYTPRAFDRKAATLVIDFALHQAGPATAWAMGAAVGDALEIGGPRGSQVVSDDFDWYLLIGDETALPAMGRWVETLRPGAPVTTMAVIDDEAERQSFATRAAWTGLWLQRGNRADGSDDAALVRQALAAYPTPPGDGYVWIAGEARFARALRAVMLQERGHPKAWVKASGYWSNGQAGAHETIDD